MTDNSLHTEIDTHTYFEEIGAWPKGHNGRPGMVFSYTIGFIFSLVLTFAAYGIAVGSALSLRIAIALAVLACTQFVVQIICFLHLSFDRESRARMVVLLCALVTVVILASGSLWIMFTLNGRMMSNNVTGMQQMLQYMDDQNGGI